jgi:hypothetical protein
VHRGTGTSPLLSPLQHLAPDTGGVGSRPCLLHMAVDIRGSKGDEPDADGNSFNVSFITAHECWATLSIHSFNVCAQVLSRYHIIVRPGLLVAQEDLPCTDGALWWYMYHAKRTCECGLMATPAGICIHDLVLV